VTPTISWPLSYRFIGDDSGLAREFLTLLAGCGFVSGSGERADLTVIAGSGREAHTSEAKGISILEWRGLTITQHAQQILFTYGPWHLDLNLPNLTFHCSGPDPEPGQRLGFREFFLLSAVLFTMHRLGYFELHAASCAHDDSGYLFLGPSGSGKTTAMLSLISTGWNYLSDDAIAVSADSDGRIVSRALRRSFSLKPDHLERHPELAGYAMEPVPATDKQRIDPRQIWPAQYAAAASPKFIIDCKVADAEATRIRPIPRAESLARLVASTPWVMFDRATAPAHLDTFRTLAATCSSFELRAGREVFRDSGRLASLIAPAVLHEKWFSAKRDEAWV
jgi:hypothetical protein